MLYLSSPEAAPAASSCAAPKPLTLVCDRCEDGTRWTSRHGGNDPDVWPIGRCETCDGTGLVPIHCEACWEPAVRVFEGNPLCMAHFEEWSADALSMAEDCP
jgi:hypothetical protein